MKKLFYLLTILTILVSCKTSSYSQENVFGASMKAKTEIYTIHQFDSICTVDRLNKDLKAWHENVYFDNETSNAITKYVYIKNINENNSTVYILVPYGDKYKITKRYIVE